MKHFFIRIVVIGIISLLVICQISIMAQAETATDSSIPVTNTNKNVVVANNRLPEPGSTDRKLTKPTFIEQLEGNDDEYLWYSLFCGLIGILVKAIDHLIANDSKENTQKAIDNLSALIVNDKPQESAQKVEIQEAIDYLRKLASKDNNDQVKMGLTWRWTMKSKEFFGWFCSAAFVGYLGVVTNLLSASAQTAVMVGIAWPLVYKEIKTKWGKPS